MSSHNNCFKKENYGAKSVQEMLKIPKIPKILYCGMTRFRNVKLGVFRQYQNTKNISKKKNMGQSCFKNFSKF